MILEQWRRLTIVEFLAREMRLGEVVLLRHALDARRSAHVIDFAVDHLTLVVGPVQATSFCHLVRHTERVNIGRAVLVASTRQLAVGRYATLVALIAETAARHAPWKVLVEPVVGSVVLQAVEMFRIEFKREQVELRVGV
mgnify:CR=1 FL=1